MVPQPDAQAGGPAQPQLAADPLIHLGWPTARLYALPGGHQDPEPRDGSVSRQMGCTGRCKVFSGAGLWRGLPRVENGTQDEEGKSKSPTRGHPLTGGPHAPCPAPRRVWG